MCICKFLPRLFKRNNPMAAIDPSGIQALIDVLAADIQKISEELASATAVQTALDQANADLAASQASVADLQAKLKAQTDALAALLPPAA